MAGLIDYASSVAGEAKKNVQGLLADPKQALKDILNNLALKAAAQQAATKAAWATRDPKIMAQNALDSSQTALGFAPLGITAWHGSPHKFDKFKKEAIGTGEGAQAYGHGLYLAESPAVANEYAAKLGKPELVFGGKPITQLNVSQEAKDAAKWIKSRAGAMSYGAQGRTARDDFSRLPEKIRKELGNVDLFDGGNLYKTDIPEEAVARFLDWDKPLSQQAPEVQAGLSKALAKRPGMTGAELYNVFGGSGALRQDLNTNFGFGKQASETLKELGIPGIRYLDGGSRGYHVDLMLKDKLYATNKFDNISAAEQYAAEKAAEGFTPKIDMRGSSNFVAFDPEMIRILERNGQATGAVPWQPGEWRGLLGNN